MNTDINVRVPNINTELPDLGPYIDKEYKKKRIEETSKIILSMIGVANRTLSRYKQAQDPVLRHTLFVDKFCILLDLGLATLEAFTEMEEYPIEVKLKLRELIGELQ